MSKEKIRNLEKRQRRLKVIKDKVLDLKQERIEKLKTDHANARRLAEGIDAIDGLTVRLDFVKTNIVYVELVNSAITPDQVVTAMKDKGVKFFAVGPSRFRMVTNSGVQAEGIDRALKELSSYFAWA